jgi:hypothetical protein
MHKVNLSRVLVPAISRLTKSEAAHPVNNGAYFAAVAAVAASGLGGGGGSRRRLWWLQPVLLDICCCDALHPLRPLRPPVDEEGDAPLLALLFRLLGWQVLLMPGLLCLLSGRLTHALRLLRTLRILLTTLGLLRLPLLRFAAWHVRLQRLWGCRLRALQHAVRLVPGEDAILVPTGEDKRTPPRLFWVDGALPRVVPLVDQNGGSLQGW